MTAEVINAKQGLTRIPTYAELIKEIDREKFKTNDIRKIFDRNAWYFHESPQGQALNTNNIHPADLQQMNFKKMAEEATARKEEETPNLDFEDMTDLRDDAISDFEMSFDREAELREENERRVAEQANLSHSQDHYMANKGAYDAVGATASAGIQEDEEPPSSSRSILKNFLKSSKPVIKAVATAGGTAKANRRTNSIKTDRRHHTRRRRGRETVQDKTNTKTNQQTSQKGKSPKEVKGGKIKDERRCSAQHRRSNGYNSNTNSRKEETLKRETVQSKETETKTANAGEERISGRPIHNHQTAQSKKSKRKATPTTSIRSNNQHPQRQQDTQCR